MDIKTLKIIKLKTVTWGLFLSDSSNIDVSLKESFGRGCKIFKETINLLFERDREKFPRIEQTVFL